MHHVVRLRRAADRTARGIIMDYVNELRHRVVKDGALTAVLAFVAAGAIKPVAQQG